VSIRRRALAAAAILSVAAWSAPTGNEEELREFCRAISFMMKELRSQGTKKSDSTIQY